MSLQDRRCHLRWHGPVLEELTDLRRGGLVVRPCAAAAQGHDLRLEMVGVHEFPIRRSADHESGGNGEARPHQLGQVLCLAPGRGERRLR